jgi:hypothetical protein
MTYAVSAFSMPLVAQSYVVPTGAFNYVAVQPSSLIASSSELQSQRLVNSMFTELVKAAVKDPFGDSSPPNDSEITELTKEVESLKERVKNLDIAVFGSEQGDSGGNVDNPFGDATISDSAGASAASATDCGCNKPKSKGLVGDVKDILDRLPPKETPAEKTLKELLLEVAKSLDTANKTLSAAAGKLPE